MLSNYCWKLNVKAAIADWRFRIWEAFEIANKKPLVKSSERSVDLGCLKANDDSYMLIAITNIHSLKKHIDSFEIKIDKDLGDFKKAVLYTRSSEETCMIEYNRDTIVKIHGIDTAGYLLLTK